MSCEKSSLKKNVIKDYILIVLVGKKGVHSRAIENLGFWIIV